MWEQRIDEQAGEQTTTTQPEASFGRRENRKHGWFWAYDALFDLAVSAHAKLVYLNLCRRAGKQGESHAAHARIAHDCALSVRTVRRALQELVQAGAIRVKSRKREGRQNLYYLTDMSEWQGWSAPQTDPSAPQTDPSAPQTDKGRHIGTTYKDSRSSGERKLVPTQQADKADAAGPERDNLPSTGQPDKLPPQDRERQEPAPQANAPQPDSARLPSSSTSTPERQLKERRRQIVQEFYQQLGQVHISRQKLTAGEKILADLQAQGFRLEQIRAAIVWLLSHQDQFGGHVYSLGLLPQMIGQAQQDAEQAAERAQRAAEKQRQHAEEERRLNEEHWRRQRLVELYQTLDPTEQATLRTVAVENLLQTGIPQRFLLEPLVTGEICRLLPEQTERPFGEDRGQADEALRASE